MRQDNSTSFEEIIASSILACRPAKGRLGEMAESGSIILASQEATFEDTLKPSYHPPKVGWDEKWNGLGWRDMPGGDQQEVIRKLNFALYRRGLYDPERDGGKKAARAAMDRHFIKLNRAAALAQEAAA